MGMSGSVGGFGQSQGDTGVGASPTTTGQSQPMGQQYGGKGGSMGAGPQLQQPSQSSTTQSQTQQPYQPMGGNVLGYNMNRLASRMDPSASLPGDNTQQQQPQYQQMPIPQPLQSSFGGKGGGRGGYEPSFFEQQYPQQYQQQYQQQPQQQQNPFAEKQSQYDNQISSLQDRLDKLISQQQAATNAGRSSELKDTGEVVTNMDPGRTKTGVGTQSFVDGDTLSNEDISQSQADSKAAADAAAAKIDPATGKPKYQYGTYTAATTEQLSGLSNKANISSYFKTQATKASQDLAQAKKDLANAQKSGDIAAMTAAQKVQSEALQRQAAIAADQKQALSQVGKTGYQTTEQIQAAQKAQSDAAAKAAADKAASQKAAADKIAADKAASQKAAADKIAADKAARDKAARDKAAAQKAAAQKAAADKAARDKAAQEKAAADKAAKEKAAAEKAAAQKAAKDQAAAAKAAKAQAAAAKKPAKPMAKGGTVIVHKGMTSNLKKQLKNK